MASHTLSHLFNHRMYVVSHVCWVGRVGLSVHAVVFGAPTLSLLLNTSHITLPYLCACVPERAQCVPQAAVLPVMVCTYLPCSVTDLLFTDHQRLQQQTQCGTKCNLCVLFVLKCVHTI